MNRILLLFAMLACTMAALAQGTVKGRVLDKQTNDVLQFVNIRLTDYKSGKMIKGAITDGNGSFHLTEVPYGNYKLTVSYVGYKNAIRNITLSDKNKSAHYTAIYIAEDQQTLKEVKVTGQRSQMKLEVDRKTFTVDQVLAAAGGSVSELLENIPSVEVTTDGEISLRGNSSVEVWINGKSSGLTAENRGEILQQIPAESIEKIEVIDNPSAKYSAEGSAGIINIILKKDRKAGYYGSLRAGVDTQGGWNTGGNINYSSGKLDAYANVGYRARKGGGGSLSEQTYLKSQTYQNYESENDNDGGNLFTRAGLTWYMTDKDELSIGGMAMFGKHENNSMTPYRYGSVGALSDSYIMHRQNSGEGDMNMYNAELGYIHKFAERNMLTVNLSFHNWKSDNESWYQDSTAWLDGSQPTTYSYQYRPMHVNNKSWEARVDYENQITDKLKLEAGYNARLSRENTPQESYSDKNSWNGANMQVDEDYYNRFIYDMDIHAFYATVNTKIGKLGVMAGLRGEYWKVNTESYNYEQEHDPSKRFEPFKKDYFELFPSLFLNYPITETAQIQLNYTRRMRRPWGGQLNNFKNTNDASMVTFGNPELTPEFSNSFTLNFLKTWNEHSLSVGAYYRPTTDVIERVSYNVNDTMYSTSENLAKSQSAGIEIIGKNRLWRILDLTTTVNAYYYKLDGFNYNIYDQVVKGEGDENFSWDARVLASLILPYDISFQATGNYRSKRLVTQGYRKPNASLDLGLRKTFLNKAIALSVNWRDVFNSRRWKTYTGNDTFERYQENWRDPRVNFVLTWNFGNMKAKRKPMQNEVNESYDMQGGYGEGGEF